MDSQSRAIPGRSAAPAPPIQTFHAPPGPLTLAKPAPPLSVAPGPPTLAKPAPPLSVVTPTALPLPPTAPNQTTQRNAAALTSMKPLSQYSIAVLRKAVSLHQRDITNATADQLATQQAIVTSLSHLKQLQGRVESLEHELKRQPTGSDNSKLLATELESARIIRSKERDRVIELRASENRHNYNISASRLDVQKMEKEIQSRQMPTPNL